jgi:hypothetical protein
LPRASIGLFLAVTILAVMTSAVSAGIPCPGLSEVWAETDRACVGDTIEAYVIIRDCYGEPIYDRTCTFYSDRDCVDKLMGRNPTTDAGGFAQATIKTFSAGETHIYVVCDGVILGPSPPVTWLGSEPFLRVGSWVIAEPWREWIGAAGDTTQLELHICDVAGDIDSVAFFYDVGGGWIYISTDTDGSAGHPNDGWSAYFDHNLIAQVDQAISFKAEAMYGTCTFEYTVQRIYDPTPPSNVTFNIVDWDTVRQETLYLDLTPNGVDVDSVVVDLIAKPDTFYKDIPPLAPNTMLFPEKCHAAKATAACFKWFEIATGDTHLTGGLDDSTLVDSLCYYYLNVCSVKTEDDPQQFPRWVLGTGRWIENHCHGYTVQDFEHALPYDCHPWDYEFWRYVRGELEECENVLMAFRWPGTDWRALTWNSLVNDSLPDGRYLCDWYDPATNAYEWGEVDPYAGIVNNFTGPLNDTPSIYKTIVISPKWYDWKNPPYGEYKKVVEYDGSPIQMAMPYPPGPCHWWLIRIIVKDTDGNVCVFKFIVKWMPQTGIEEGSGELPKVFNLGRGTPNPFGDRTEIRYTLPGNAALSLGIYDVLGKKVRTLVSGSVEAGYHTAVWDGRDDRRQPVAPGIYYARMATPGYTGTSKLIHLR